MVDLIVILILLGIAGGIIGYLWAAKKRGVTCVGCPHAKGCSGKCGSCGSCNGTGDAEDEKKDQAEKTD